jgi:hypothetical protein
VSITTALPDEVIAGLLPALLDDDPGEQAVTHTLLEHADLAARLGALTDGLAALLEAATAPATRRAYESDFRHFAGWAAAHGLAALPAALYVTAHQDLLRPSSLVCRLARVAARHRGAGARLPRPPRAGPPRGRGLALLPRPPSRGQGRACHRPARGDLRRPAGSRRLAGPRRSPAPRPGPPTALDVGDLTENDAGLAVFIQRSKTDQEGLGDFVGIAHGHPAGNLHRHLQPGLPFTPLPSVSGPRKP